MGRLGWALALWWRAACVGGESTYDILALFYRTTNGDNWYHNEGWLVGDPCDGTWMTTSKYDCYSGELTDSYQPICCELVSQTDSSPRVVKLDLHENNLEGTIPDSLLTALKVLALDGNRISGTLPNGFKNMWNLNVLWLQHNLMSGSIPHELGKVTTFVDRGCFLQGNDFHFCEREDKLSTDPPTLPPLCTTKGPDSPTQWLGAASYPCINFTTTSAPRSFADREYSDGALLIMIVVLASSAVAVVVYEIVYGEAGNALPCPKKRKPSKRENAENAAQVQEASFAQPMSRWRSESSFNSGEGSPPKQLNPMRKLFRKKEPNDILSGDESP